MKLVSVEDMRAIEKAADAGGHSYAAMMDKAGTAVAQAVLQRRDMAGQRVLVLVGPGNNGGDGLVAARVLRQAGAETACYLLKPRSGSEPNFRAAREAGCFVACAPDDAQQHVLGNLVRGADVIVDALLGTGTQRPLEGEMAAVLQLTAAEVSQRHAAEPASLTRLTDLNPASDVPLLVGVDGPTGMNYDTGELDPLALHLDLSVTFAYPKLGHFRFPAAGACGELLVADIGIDPGLAGSIRLEVADAGMIAALLPARPLDAHKGSFGKALIVAGSIYYSGAAALAAMAAYRVGGGLVTLAAPRAIYSALAAGMREATYLVLPDDMGVVTPAAVKLLDDKAGDYQAMLVGPGLSAEKEAIAFVQRLFGLEQTSRKTIGFQPRPEANANESPANGRPNRPPLVVDADGLNSLAQVEGWWERLPAQTILTPHPGEMARLMKAKGNDADARPEHIQAERWETASRQARAWGHIVVLKGAFSVVAAPDGRTTLLPFANPAMATAGSGDVLAGAIVGLLGQGLAPFEAAVCGAYLHGLAGEIARREVGPAGVTAGDILARLPQALRETTE